MFGYKKKYNDLIYKIILLKDTKEIYTEHLKVIYKGTEGDDEIRLGTEIKANLDLIETLDKILKHSEEKIGIFGYKKKYKEFRHNVYLLREKTLVQRDQSMWRIDFDNSSTDNHYSAEERSRLEGLYEYTAKLIIELNDILGVKI